MMLGEAEQRGGEGGKVSTSGEAEPRAAKVKPCSGQFWLFLLLLLQST